MSEPQRPLGSQAQLMYEDDSINLGLLFQTVWAQRRLILLVLIAFTALFWLVAGARGLRAPKFARFTKDIKLVFVGVTEAQYPDGTGFFPTHLIAPAILNEVYESNSLANLGISIGTFVDAMAVEAYAPESAFIEQRYRDLLDIGGLSVAQIEALGAQFSQELQQAARSGIRLSFTLRSSAIPDEIAWKILNDVPFTWQRYMIERRGIFRTEGSFVSSRGVNHDLLSSSDYIVAYDILSSKLRGALQNIATLRELPNSENIGDPETGLALTDLKILLEDLRDYSLEQAVGPALDAGVSRNREATTRYFRKRVTDLTRERALLEEKARLMSESFMTYSSTDRAQTARIEGAVPDSRGGLPGIPQFSGDFLDRLVELGTNSADMEFRQAMTREQLDYALRSAEISSEVQRLTDLVDRLDRIQPRRADDATDLSRQRQTEETEESFQRVQQRLIELMDVSLRIRTELEQFNYGTDQALYRDSGTAKVETTEVVFTMENLSRYGLLTLLLLMALPVAVVVQSFLSSAKRDNVGQATPGA